MTTHELNARTHGALTIAGHDAAVARKTVLEAIAGEVITELVNRPDVIADYQECGDHVFIEESVDMRLLAAGIDTEAYSPEYLATTGLVFAWLFEYHHIEPPAWFTHETRMWQA